MNTFDNILLVLYFFFMTFSFWGTFKIFKSDINYGLNITTGEFFRAMILSITPLVNIVYSLCLLTEYSTTLFDQKIFKKVLFKGKSNEGE